MNAAALLRSRGHAATNDEASMDIDGEVQSPAMKRTLHFAWLTAVAGVLFANRRRKVAVEPDFHCVWFAQAGGHQVVDGKSIRVPVQAEHRLGRIRRHARRIPRRPG